MTVNEIKQLALWTGIAVLLILGVGFSLNYAAFKNCQILAPKQEQAHNDRLHQPQVYNNGMVRDLEELKRQYAQSTPDQQGALRPIILHRFEAYPPSKLPPDLEEFCASLQYEETQALHEDTN
jgi:hypothetical protein